VGEVCNIRLEDIDQVKQTIFVRLPTKGKETRTVPYHDKVAKHLAQWLELRDPDCPHDRLIHGNRLGFYTSGSLDERFKVLLGTEAQPAVRHSFATRNVNAGMSAAVLQELMGHASLTTTQRYFQIKGERISREYFSVMEFVRQCSPV
jgi:integrase/recombinase XerC